MEFRRKAVKNNRMEEADVNVSDELLLLDLMLVNGDYLTRASLMIYSITTWWTDLSSHKWIKP